MPTKCKNYSNIFDHIVQFNDSINENEKGK